MSNAETTLLDLDAIDRSPLNRDPFDFLVVKDAIAADKIATLNQDYPVIDRPANFSPKDLSYGPSFGQLLKELDSDEFEQHVADKFGVNLSGCVKTITARKYSEPSDGNIHTDHWSKVLTLLVYFNPEWNQQGGKLRMLRSLNDIEDYAAEVAPVGGTVLAFRRSSKSFHGYRQFDGERRMVQMSWVRQTRLAWYSQQLARFGTHTFKRLARIFQKRGRSD